MKRIVQFNAGYISKRVLFFCEVKFKIATNKWKIKRRCMLAYDKKNQNLIISAEHHEIL